MPSLTQFLENYGYWAVLVGTFLEGETILLMAGFAAHRGYLGLPGVVLAAFAGSLAGDQLAFFVGRTYGARVLDRFQRLRPGVERAKQLMERHGTPLLLGFRFVYGIRNVTPLAAGITRVAAPRFVLLNAIGAAAWSVLVASIGYLFGQGFELVLDRARAYEEYALFAILALGLLAALVAFVRTRRARPRGAITG